MLINQQQLTPWRPALFVLFVKYGQQYSKKWPKIGRPECASSRTAAVPICLDLSNKKKISSKFNFLCYFLQFKVLSGLKKHPLFISNCTCNTCYYCLNLEMYYVIVINTVPRPNPCAEKDFHLIALICSGVDRGEIKGSIPSMSVKFQGAKKTVLYLTI